MSPEDEARLSIGLSRIERKTGFVETTESIMPRIRSGEVLWYVAHDAEIRGEMLVQSVIEDGNAITHVIALWGDQFPLWKPAFEAALDAHARANGATQIRMTTTRREWRNALPEWDCVHVFYREVNDGQKSA